jgi:ABC-type bacteriocin/lantibiotic exporter with double-glycine peptidase domain
MNYFNTIKLFISNLIKKNPKEFISLVLLMIAEAIIIAFSVLSLIPFADYLLDPSLSNPNKVTTYLLTLFDQIDIGPNYFNFAFIFIATNLIRALLSLLIKYKILKIKFSIEKSFSAEILEKIFLSKWSFFNNFRYGTILNSLTKELNFIGTASRVIGEVFASFFNICTYIMIPFFIDPIMTSLIIISCFLLGLPFLFLSKTSKKYGELRTQAGNAYIGKLNETIHSAKLIMGFGLYKKEVKNNVDFLQNYINTDLKSQTVNLIAIYLFKPLGIIVLIFSFGLLFDSQNIPAYAAIFWSFYGALPLIGQILNTAVVINNYEPSYRQIASITDRADQYLEIDGKEKITKINSDIIFDNISFSYDGRKKILNNCSIKIPVNKITTLVGDSGAGKSTILDLLMGFQKAHSGNILINNTEINEINLKHFRLNIGYVPQDPMLFHTSIKNNITWSKDNDQIDENEVIQALKLSNAYDFVMKFPKKIETMVGEKGTEISGGQRQRIALARALFRKPKVLILDEATSSIDLESELLIVNSLKKISNFITILMIAHSESSIKISDRIINIKNGEAKLLKDLTNLPMK